MNVAIGPALIRALGWRGARPRVVIVGAGFAGLAAAKALAKAPVEVTVIDRRNYHLFQPLLYQVATAGLSPADIATPIRSILRDQANTQVLLGRVDGIDKAVRVVEVEGRRVAYDTLIIATGARHGYFGHDDWEDVAPGLKKIDDATKLRHRILQAFEEAETTDNAEERRRLLNFVIIGGGPTGVELAGAIAELAKVALARDFRQVDPRSSRIILVEFGKRVLSSFPEPLSAFAKKALEKLGVEVRLGHPATVCDAGGVVVDGQRIEARTIIWAAGVAASPAAKWLDAEMDRAGRVIVGRELTLPGYSEIFVLGDTAAAPGLNGKALPGSCVGRQAAGRLCGPTDCCANQGQARAAALPIPQLRQSRDDRAQGGGRRFRPHQIERSACMAALGCHPRVAPGRVPQPHRRDARLALGVHYVRARCPPHY